MNRALDDWFASEILPHEAALMRYVTRVWKLAADVPDLCQETYVRVYESAAKKRPRAAKSFLFTTAHNLMVDRMRRERVVSIGTEFSVRRLAAEVQVLVTEGRVGLAWSLARPLDRTTTLDAGTVAR